MRYYQIDTPLASWSSRVNGQHNPYAQQVEFSIEIISHSPSGNPNSTMVIHGIPWELIDQAHNFAGMDISIYGGMAPGLPLATFQSRTAGPLIQGKILRCWGNWIGTDMSLGFSFIPAGISPVGGGGAETSGAPGLGTSSTSGETITPSVMPRFNRVGARSIDRMPFAKATPNDGVLRNFPTRVNPPGSIGPLIGGVQQWLTPLQQIGMATATIGGFNVAAIGGGGSGGYPLTAPLNLVHDMQPGQQLSSAVKQTLSRAFRSAGVDVRIKPASLGYQDSGMYQSMEQYAQYIHKLSNSILGSEGYLGVHMSSKDNTIHVWDGTSPVSQCNIDPLDLIGQPTWIEPYKISVKTVMRADLDVGGIITLPDTIFTINAMAAMPAGAPQRTNLGFHGSFTITKVLHIGDFRNPDGVNWCTNIEAVEQGSPSDINASEM